jgi:hypothetical protein
MCIVNAGPLLSTHCPLPNVAEFIVYWQLRLPPRLPVAFATPVPREPATRVASP